jgi:hypothetical protein
LKRRIKLKKENETLKQKLKDCKEKKREIKYAPGGIGYQRAKEEFESTRKKYSKK